MDSYQNILQTQFAGNSIQNLTIAVGLLLGVFLSLRIVRRFGVKKLDAMASKTRTQLDDALIEVLHGINGPLNIVISLFVATRFLILSHTVERVLHAVFIIGVVYEAVIVLQMLLVFLVQKVWMRDGEEAQREQVSSLLKLIIRIILWTTGLLLILSNLGFNITSLVASLGIGGIAIALAVQNILGDMFSSFSIYFDQPFRVGDFVIVGEHMGTVKKIGLKTTRLQALQGEEIVISNTELTSSRVRNFKRMQKRRIEFHFGVTYGTPLEKLKKIPDILRNIIDPLELSEFNRTHLKRFGDSSLDFEVVYFLLSADYDKYMDIQQTINLGMIEAFELEGIKFAFPTRTMHIAA